MTQKDFSRRQFLATASVGTMAAVTSKAFPAPLQNSRRVQKLAILGGEPVRKKSFPSWPVWDKKDETALLKALNSGQWGRFGGKTVTTFEEKFADLMGAKYCLGTQSGTQALHTSLYSLGIGAGDEVLVSVYTFVASADAIFLCNALPVFVDVDPETYQLDPAKIEAKITKHTKAIMPVDILGAPVHIDKIQAIAKKHNLKIVEDACQAHMGEWENKKLGNFGDLGCFSFQGSKNINCGEGGAIIGEDKDLMDRCFSFHNFGRAAGSELNVSGYVRLGTKYRMTAFQAAIMLSQMERAEEQARIRNENGSYLTDHLKQIPGINPQKFYKGTTRSAYHLYAMRYNKEHFNNIPRDNFIKALRAEGISCSKGYGTALNKELFIEDTLDSPAFQKIYSQEQLSTYRKNLDCPENEKLITESVWFSQQTLLGNKKDMDDIIAAITKIYENRNKLA